MEATITLPEMKSVESSNIDAIGHEGSTMFVRFKRGTVYSYANVPYEVYAEILTAESVGKSFNSLVKTHPDLFPFKQVI